MRSADGPARAALLEVRALSLAFRTRTGALPVLDRVSLAVAPGEHVALVGESGSGKTALALAVAGLSDPAARITGGSILWRGRRIDDLPERERRRLRGAAIAMVFQNPQRALNPIRPVGRQLADALATRRRLGAAAARAEALALLRAVRIDAPEARLTALPGALSGGQCQRVMLALALACAPQLLIADEPTTGLDVTTQAAVMDLLAGLAAERGMALVTITHDLALAAERSGCIVVMHAGQVVETAPPGTLFAAAAHPYTRGLIRATPASAATLADLVPLPGGLPDLAAADLPACRFADRCALALPRCRRDPPPATDRGPGHRVWCWNPA